MAPQFNKNAILDMAKSQDPQDRQNLADSVGSICLEDYTYLNDQERALFTEIMLHLLNTATLDLKKSLALSLSDHPQAPRPLMEALAQDDFFVAEVVLSKCAVLSDRALVDIIRHRTLQHQMAIACRKHLNEQVSDAIIEQNNPLLITELLKNKGAKIGEATLRYLVDQSKKIDVYRNPLLSRDDLLPEHAATMYQWVGETLREEICKKFNLEENDVQNLLDKAMAIQLSANMRPVHIPFAWNTVTPVAAAPPDDPIDGWPKVPVQVLPLSIPRCVFPMRVYDKVAKLTQIALVVNANTHQVAWVVVHAKRPGCVRCKHNAQGFGRYTDGTEVRSRPAFHREANSNFRCDRSHFGKGFAEVLNTDAAGLRMVRRVEDTKCLCPSDCCNCTHTRRHFVNAFRTHRIIRRQQLLRRTKVNRAYRESCRIDGIYAFLGWFWQVDAVKPSTRTPHRKLWKWEPAACPRKP